MYKCGRCGYETSRKYNFELHQNRKTPCSINRKINITEGRICNKCSQVFPNRQAKYRHVKNNNCTPTNDNKIKPFSVEAPYVDHIDRDLIKDLYLSNDRSVKKLINETIRKIYGDFRSNNSFRFPMGVKSNAIEVFSNERYQLLPLQDVLQTVLQQTSALCELYLRSHYQNKTIMGITCLIHANILKELSSNNELSHKKKDEYYPFVKAAIIECCF